MNENSEIVYDKPIEIYLRQNSQNGIAFKTKFLVWKRAEA